MSDRGDEAIFLFQYPHKKNRYEKKSSKTQSKKMKKMPKGRGRGWGIKQAPRKIIKTFVNKIGDSPLDLF